MNGTQTMDASLFVSNKLAIVLYHFTDTGIHKTLQRLSKAAGLMPTA